MRQDSFLIQLVQRKKPPHLGYSTKFQMVDSVVLSKVQPPLRHDLQL
jgi:hypothetical protein